MLKTYEQKKNTKIVEQIKRLSPAALITANDNKRLLQRVITTNDSSFQFTDNAKNDFIKSTTVNNLETKLGRMVALSTREVECAYLLSIGKTAKEISVILNIQPRTAEAHIFNVKIKLDCHYKDELINIFNEDLAGYYKAEIQHLRRLNLIH